MLLTVHKFKKFPYLPTANLCALSFLPSTIAIAFLRLWRFGDNFLAKYIFSVVVNFMIHFSMVSKIDCRNSLFLPAPLHFLADSSAVHTEFLTSNYSKVLCIRLQSHFPICVLNRELYLEAPENQPPSSPAVAAACYTAFLYRIIGWGKIKHLLGLPWPLCTDPLVPIQLRPEIS